MSAAPEIITILRFHRLRSSPIVISDLTTRRGKREGGAHSINFVKRKSRSSSSLFLSPLPRSPSFSYHLLFSFPPPLQKKTLRISWIFSFQFSFAQTGHVRRVASGNLLWGYVTGEAFIDGSRNIYFIWFDFSSIRCLF